MRDLSHKNNYELIEASQFEVALYNAVKNSKKRISITTMTVEVGELTERIFTEIERSLKRRVDVKLVFDIYSTSFFQERGLLKAASIKKTKKALENLSRIGAEVHFVGKVGLDPFKHRSHQKIFVIDDTVFTFGGINLTSKSFKNNDFMLCIKNNALANLLDSVVSRLALGEVAKNESLTISDSDTILIDQGEEDSIIYDKALELARKSKRIVFVSRMCPSGELAGTIKNAENYSMYYNHISDVPFPTAMSIIIDRIRYKLPNAYNGSDFLHAKFMLFELYNGDKVVLTGSHNFNMRGVDKKTKEIALLSNDLRLFEQLNKYTNKVNRS